MRVSRIIVLFSAACISVVSRPCAAGPGPVVMPGIVTVTATETSAPPAWAVMERFLIDSINEAAPEFLEKYSERDGRMPLIGKPDDMYEVFGNWPLFYVLGGDERILDMGLRQWNAITRELTAVKRIDREFVVHYDWFHHSENYKNFYYFGLADPSIPEMLDRSKRFADLYTGADSLAPNYDPKLRMMRSPVTGSTGPLFEQDGVYLINHGHASLYPFIKEELEPGWEKDPKRSKTIQKLYNDVVMKGDTPVSLSAAALAANAYLSAGDERYKKWIVEYADAWMERIRENKGIIPDNIGPSGKIGELRKGQWWGGHFGWNARYSLHMILGAVTTASEAAYLVTGDPKYPGLLRSQLDVLFANARKENGALLFPYRYGAKGWYDYRPLEIRELSHLWNLSMAPADMNRIETALNGFISGPRPYDNYNDYAMPVTGHLTYRWAPNGKPVDFTRTVSNGDIGDLRQEQEELNEAPRFFYLQGRNPDFPLRMLEADYSEMLRRIEESRGVTDIYKVPGLHSEYLAELNPVVVKSLVFLTLGGPAAIYNGGLLQVRVRWFDMDHARPGLPEDVAALVERIEPERTVIRLVNLSATAARRLIVQAGAYGEHRFTRVVIPGGGIGERERTVEVNGSAFAVELPPAKAITLDAGMKRFVNTPSYAFPWDKKGR